MRTHVAFLVFSLLSSCLFALLNPPFMVPDEQQHFARAYQLAFAPGSVVVEEGRAGAQLPTSLLELSDTFLHTRELHGRRLVEPHPMAETLATLNRPLDPGRTTFVDFSGSAFYSPLPYMPQIAGLLLARATGLGPAGLFYAGRVLNAVCATLVAALAIRFMCRVAAGFAVVGLLPMTQYLFGSLSPDASVIACSMLSVAVVSRALAEGRWRVAHVAIAIASGLVMCTLKPVYAPLLLVGAVATVRQGGLRQAILVYGLLLSVVVGGSLLWLSLNKSVFVQPVPNTDVAGQLALVIARPSQFLMAILNGARLFWREWLAGILGLFGWLNLSLPPIIYLLVLLVIGGSLAFSSDSPAPGRLEALWTMLMVVTSGGLVLLALYLYWNPVGSTAVLGIQGRYLLPLASAAMFSIDGAIGQRSLPRRRHELAVIACSFLLVLSSIVIFVQAYGIV